MLKKEDNNLNFVAMEKEMLKVWENGKYFEKLVEQNKKGKKKRSGKAKKPVQKKSKTPENETEEAEQPSQ